VSRRHEQIQLQWGITKGVEGNNNWICLSIVSSFYKVWVLALHGFSLLDYPQPIDHDNPHRKEIRSELICWRFIEKGLV
jgi:hypothetical protein